MKKILITIILIIMVPFIIYSIKDIGEKPIYPELDIEIYENYNSKELFNNYRLQDLFAINYLDTYNYKVNDTLYNYIEYNPSSHTYDYKEIVGYKMINGNYNWSIYNKTLSNVIQIVSSGVFTNADTTLLETDTAISNLYIQANLTTRNDEGFMISGTTGNIYISILKSNIPGYNDLWTDTEIINNCKIYLNNNNLEVYYKKSLFAFPLFTDVPGGIDNYIMNYFYNIYKKYPTWDYVNLYGMNKFYNDLNNFNIENDNKGIKIIKDDIILKKGNLVFNTDYINIVDYNNNILTSYDIFNENIITPYDLGLEDTYTMEGFNILGYYGEQVDSRIKPFLILIPILLVGTILYFLIGRDERE